MKAKIYEQTRDKNIPLIFHQMYKSYMLPIAYLPPFRSLIANHRLSEESNENIIYLDDNLNESLIAFRYMFWSDESIQNYIQSKLKAGQYSYHVLTKYSHILERADAIRYFILYEFGGIYLDLDVELFNSLIPYLKRGFSCMLTRETPEQPFVIGNEWRIVSNSIMMCRPGHPFFRLVIDSLLEFLNITKFKAPECNIIFRTGPFFITKILDRYRSKMPSKLAALCAIDARLHPDCVHEEDDNVFEENQYIHLPRIKRMCNENSLNSTPLVVQQRCQQLLLRKKKYGSFVKRGTPELKLGVHHHLNIGYANNKYENTNTDFDLRSGIDGYWEYSNENYSRFIKLSD